MKKILHFADTDSIQTPGGIEKVIKNCIKYSPSGYSATFVKLSNVKKFSFFNKAFPSKRKIKNIVKELSPDVIHLHGSTPFIWMCIQIILKLKVKIVVTPFFHQPKFTRRKLLAFLNYFFLRKVLSNNIKVHFCSSYEKNFFNEVKDINSYVFPPFFISEEKAYFQDKKNILFVGRDDAHKGLSEFIKVSDYFPYENFIAVTKPKKKLNLPKNFSVLSDISDQELDTLYFSGKILIFPSAYESFGGVFLEALSNNCLVICSSMVLGVEFFKGNENLFIYNYSSDEKKNIENIKIILDKILSSKISFTHYGKNEKRFNSISKKEHVDSYTRLYSIK
tara:strand:- start:39 stop:1043 length:1005 start_codon:yes stop_codon:yes gene_type:complete